MATLWAAFGTAVHRFEPFGVQIESSPKPSGTHTARCSPPNCCIKVPIQHWTDLASRLCLDIDEEHKNKLESDNLPKVNRGVIFKSEADVVAASALYLTYPVHSAYELVYPGDKFVRELVRPSKGKSPSSRVDMAYFAGTPSDETAAGKSDNVVALLEYKKLNGLPRDQFKQGIVSNFDDYAKAWKFSQFRDRNPPAVMVLKQAVHYASRFGTHFVALCDNKTLILLVMSKV